MNMKERFCVAAVAVVVGVSSCLLADDAETFVWNGPPNGGWNVAANWEGGRVPSPGSLVVFNQNTTVGSESDVQEVDFGEAGLTIRNPNESNNEVSLWVRFRGAGKLAFDGPGRCKLKAACAHTGGSELRKSSIEFGAKENPLGTGPVAISGASGWWKGVLVCGAWDSRLPNDVTVQGLAPGAAFVVNSPVSMDGALVGDTNLLFTAYYGSLSVAGSLTVPNDCTVTFRNKNSPSLSSTWSAMRVDCPMSGNLTFEGSREVCLAGTGTVASCTFTASGMTNVIAEAGVWTGTNVVVRGESATLFLQGSGNLKPYAEVSVEEGARIDLAQGVRVRVAALRVGGESLPIGIYTAKRLPNVLSGRGRLCVGDSGAVLILR